MLQDNTTRWDTVSAGPGRKLTYAYTFVNLTKSEMEQTKIQNMNAEAKGKVCALPQLDRLFNKGVAVAFIYKDKNQDPILEFTCGSRS